MQTDSCARFAIAVARTIAVEGHAAELAAGGRVWRADGEIGNAPVLLPQERLEIVTQAVIHGQLPSDFPGVLDKPGERLRAHARFGRYANESVIHAAHHKAGERESGNTAGKRLTQGGGQRRFRRH